MKGEEREELKKREEDSEEKDLEQSIKEQKEVPQAPQSDISDIKGSLQGIESTLGKIELEMKKSRSVNAWYVFSGFVLAAGFVVIGIGASLLHTNFNFSRLALISGLFMFIGGAILFCSTYRTELGKKTLTLTILGFLFMVCSLVLPYLYIFKAII